LQLSGEMVATSAKEVPISVVLQKIFCSFLRKMQKALALGRYLSIKEAN
jgi:hypothetical protein